MIANIGIGYDEILFGMTQDDVCKIWGNPDKIITCRDDGIEWIYNDLEIKIFFGNEENERLYSIEVFDKDAIYLSHTIIGMSIDEFKCFMASKGCESFEYEEYSYFETIYCDSLNTTFTVEFGKISSFEFSPLFGKDDNVVLWPNSKNENLS